jgi:hypothetical protein
VIVARSPCARLQVELEVRVALRDAGDRRASARRERRPPEVRVQEHTGRVQHPPEGRPLSVGGPLSRTRPEVRVTLVSREKLVAALGQHSTGGSHRQRPRRIDFGGEDVDRRKVAQGAQGSSKSAVRSIAKREAAARSGGPRGRGRTRRRSRGRRDASAARCAPFPPPVHQPQLGEAAALVRGALDADVRSARSTGSAPRRPDRAGPPGCRVSRAGLRGSERHRRRL